jgi:hypothetical protein
MTFLGLDNYRTNKTKISMLPTGLVDHVNHGRVTVNALDAVKFDVSAGTAVFSDAYTDASRATSVELEFGPFTAQTLTNISTYSVTFLYLNSSGELVQETSLQFDGYLRDHIGLGIIEHPGGTVISNISNFTPVSLSNTLMSFADLTFSIGAINSPYDGQNIVSGHTASLSIDKSAGVWYYHGINADRNLKSQNLIDSGVLSAPTLLVGWRTTDNANGKYVNRTTIPAGIYDNNTTLFSAPLPVGVVTTNNWVNHRIFYVVDSHQLAVQIGQVTYNSLANAILGMATEVFVPLVVFAGTTPIATVSMRGGAADLADPGDANFRQAIPPRATFQ